MAETSRLWGRISSCGRWASRCRDLDRGQLGVETEVAFSKEMEAPDHGTRVTFGYSTIERWYLTSYSEGPSPRAIQEATRRRTSQQSHQPGSSLPGEPGKTHLRGATAFSSDLGSVHKGA